VTFFIGAALLSLLAIGFVLAPWWRREPVEAADAINERRQATIEIVRARLAELDSEKNEGAIDEATWQSLKLEQERRLLDDVRGLDTQARTASGKLRWALPLVAALTPLLAFALYHRFGYSLDVSIEQTVQHSRQQLARGENNRKTLEELSALLERRLAQRDDDDGRRRFMLARIDMELGHTERALQHYRALIEQFPQDGDLLAQFAQAQYLAAGRQLTPEVAQSAQRALELNPDQATALGLLGIAAFEQKDYAQALMHWRRLQRQLTAGSPNAQMIERGIAQAESKLGPDGLPGPKFEISVSLDSRLAGKLRGTLFVFAKAVNGPPMPLAVARFDNPTLPLTVTLDDSMAMAPGLNLSSAKQVQLIARVTASGQVRGEPGDLEGSSAPLDVGVKKQALALVIDRQL
jgi:cytochrome c-type biogenesis protein CcmH